MNNQIFFTIIIGVILLIYYIHITSPNNNNVENFDRLIKSSSTQENILSLNPIERCELMAQKKFMVRDTRTQLWLISGQEEGFNKFLPGGFGNVFVMSENPDEYLPLRTISEPNDYLLATYKGDGIRTVTNPYNKYYIIQVFIYNGYNVLGYIAESNLQLYLYVDNNGHITSTTNPDFASKIEILEV